MRPSLSVAKRPMSGSSGSGSGVRSSRWKIPPEAPARSAVMADTMLPGRAGHDEHGVGTEDHALAAVGRGPLFEGDRPPQPVGVADLDRAGVVQASRRRARSATSVRRVAGADVDRLHQRVRPLAGEGLGEAGDGATQRRGGAGLVVAVAAAEPGGGHEEGARRRDLVVQPTHRGVQQLDPDPVGLPPGGEVHALDRRPRRRGPASQ